MNKSKFLKKSLAMLLALMLVLAMIPLSASALTYEPASVKPVSADGSGTVSGSGYSWNIDFPFSSTDPKITVQLGDNTEDVYVVQKDGKETQITDLDAGMQVERNDDGTPYPFVFYVKTADGKDTSERYTVTWTMAEPSEEVTVASAMMGSIPADSVEGNTIHFTLPFGYTGSKTATIKFTNAADETVNMDGTDGKIDTNTTVGEAAEFTVTNQKNSKEVEFTVVAEEETGLTAISIGDYEGTFLTNRADAATNPNKETGTIEFKVPADFAATDLKDVVVDFTVGSYYSEATMGSDKITSGATDDLQSFYTNLTNGTGVTFTIKNANGSRAYTLKMVKDNTDTTIDRFSVVAQKSDGSDLIAVDGVVDGTNLNVTVPAAADLNRSLDLSFVGPLNDQIKQPEITVDGTNKGYFDVDGKATLTINSYTKPVTLLVTAADGKTQEYYTLTVTKAEAENNDPRVTSAKLTLNYGTDNQTEYPGVIDDEAETITFSNIPYATLDSEIQPSTTTLYTFAKTSLTSISDTLSTATFKDGATVTVTSDNNTTKKYTVKFEKAAANTGKSISDFILSEAANENLIGYNNYSTFDVAVSGSEFKVTLPSGYTTLYADFELSEGAALYDASTLKAVAPYDSEGVGTAFTATNGATYFVADESLVYLLKNGDLSGKTYTQIKNLYANNLVEYTLKTTTEDRNEARLTSTLTANDGLVTSEFGGTNGTEITFIVPASYVNNKPYSSGTAKTFFLDFTLDEGATLRANGATVLASGGMREWKNDEVATMTANNSSNPNFRFFLNGTDLKTDVELRLMNSNTPSYNTNVTSFTVTAEDSTVTTYTIKEIKVADPETDATITALTANGVAGSISDKTINVALNYGTNLGQVKLGITTGSKLADVTINNQPYSADDTYDLTNDLKITVTAENGNQNVYTVKATVGDMFSDVADDQWYYDYVLEAAELGIVKGNPDGTFKPNDKVTRADFALMTVRMLGVDEDGLEFTTTAFTDVNDETYNAAAIQCCAEKGLIGGDGDGKFRPNDSITRQEAAKIIAEALELTETDSDLFTDDNLIHEWAEDYVYQCKAAGIFGGDAGTGNFRPTDAISRAETAKIMVVAYNNK